MKKIINNILHRFKEDSLAKRKDLSDRIIEYKDLKEIRRGLVFWTAEDGQSAWQKRLSVRMKEVKFDKLCFVPSGTEMLETDDMVTLCNEDLGFGGKIQNDRLHDILAKKYDLLIDLTSSSNVLINYVLTNSQAHCIAGMRKEGSVADIILDEVAGPADFIDKLSDILAEINKY